MKSTAVAHPNIAFIKYWGQANPNLNIPPNDSLSMTKEGIGYTKLNTYTTIEFLPDYTKDTASIQETEKLAVTEEKLADRKLERVLAVINPLREKAGVDYKFRMKSCNDFPTQAGLASSASGMAALAMAAADALDLKLTKEELSTYARLGSGSAARSIQGGIVHWHQGFDHKSSYAEQLVKPENVNINAIITVISNTQKKVTSDAGHKTAKSSIFNTMRIQQTRDDLEDALGAAKNDNFSLLGEKAEDSAMYMHCVMLTSKPKRLLYWEPATLSVIKTVLDLRQSDDLECYFSIDAGPNVHVFCRPDKIYELGEILCNIKGVQMTIPVKPAGDAYITDKHLF